MRIVYLNSDSPYIIGQQGETNAVTLRVDVTEWVTDFPNGTGVILFTRPNKVVYPLETSTIELDGKTYLQTIVTTKENNVPGWVVLQAQWYNGETLVKSMMFSGKVLVSGNTPVDPTETVPDWVTQWMDTLQAAIDGAGNLIEAAEIITDDYEDFLQHISDSEAWARGTRSGEAVEPTDDTYHNNSKYYSEQIAATYEDVEAWANGTRDGVDIDSDDPAYHKNGKYYNTQAAASASAAAASASEAMTDTPEGYSNVVASISPTYDGTKTYAVGAYCLNGGKLYRCTMAITEAEATFNSAHWTQVNVGSEVADLKSATSNLNAVYPFEYSGIINPGYAQNAGTWAGTTGSTRHAIMPIKPGSKIHVVAGSSTAAEFAILTQYAKPSTGDTVYFSASTGWTQVISVTKNTETEVLTVPNDAVWLYLNLGITPGYSRTPIKLEIDGYDYIDSITGNIKKKAPLASPAFTGNPIAPTQAANDNSTKIATTEYTERGIKNAFVNAGLYQVNDPQFVHAGYLNIDPVWKDVTSSSIRCSIIPVTPGAIVNVTANANNNFEIAALKSYSEPVENQSPDVSENSDWATVIKIKKGTHSTFVLPSDAHYLYCYLGILPTYSRMPVELYINNYNYVANAADNIAKTERSRFRIMQYNLGHFNMGQSIKDDDSHERTVYYITSENYSTILDNYKSLFDDYAPHIVGFEEYDSQIFVKDADADTGTDYDMNTELFDLYFPYSDESSSSMDSRRATKSAIPFIDHDRVQVQASYEYNNQTITYTFIVSYCHYNIDGHTVATVTTPYPSTNSSYSTEQNNAMKKAAFAAVVELCKNDENVILISDTNANPELQEAIMEEILDPAGYNAVVGSGLRAVRWPITWESYTNNTKLSIDNIFYKGDMIAINYEVLFRLRNDLASDHAAVYADFVFLPKKI